MGRFAVPDTSMQRRRRLLALAAFCAGMGMTPAAKAESPGDILFQQAVVKESGERDLDAAIALYQKVIKKAGSDRLLTAKARLRMAGCYERLGKYEEAKNTYLQIVTEVSPPSGDIEQTAMSNLRKLRSQEKRESEEADHDAILNPPPDPAQISRADVMMPILPPPSKHFVFTESPIGVLVGPVSLISKAGTLQEGSADVRYQLPFQRRMPIFLEAGLIPRLGRAGIQTQTKVSDAQTTDHAELAYHYQAHVALITQLPHGKQEKVVPEMGAGVALTASQISYTSSASGSNPDAGSLTQKTYSPYLTAGLHFLPEQAVSFLLGVTYIASPYPQTVEIALQSHRQTFDFPSYLLEAGVRLQVKIPWVHLSRAAR